MSSEHHGLGKQRFSTALRVFPLVKRYSPEDVGDDEDDPELEQYKRDADRQHLESQINKDTHRLNRMGKRKLKPLHDRFKRRVFSTNGAPEVPEEQPLGVIPSELEYMRQLKHLRAVMQNPNRPWMQQVILELCYVRNGEVARAAYRQLRTPVFCKVISFRTRIEKSLTTAMHSLEAFQRRLEILAQGVLTDRMVLKPEQLEKERDTINQTRQLITDTEKDMAVAAGHARTLHDRQYLDLLISLRDLQSQLQSTGDTMLKEQVRYLSGASDVNFEFYKDMRRAATLEGVRVSGAREADAQRSARMEILGRFNLEPLTDLIALYREMALKFEYSPDRSLEKRQPPTGWPMASNVPFGREAVKQIRQITILNGRPIPSYSTLRHRAWRLDSLIESKGGLRNFLEQV